MDEAVHVDLPSIVVQTKEIPAVSADAIAVAPREDRRTNEPKTNISNIHFREPSLITPKNEARLRPKSCVVGQMQSKYRHVETASGGAAQTFTNLRNVNTRLPAESNGFCVSRRYAAVPLAGPAGIIAILAVR